MYLAAAQVTFPKVPSVVAAGSGFRLVASGMLIEAGDEYCTAGGLFVPLPLERVGQPIPEGLTVRRLSRPMCAV